MILKIGAATAVLPKLTLTPISKLALILVLAVKDMKLQGTYVVGALKLSSNFEDLSLHRDCKIAFTSKNADGAAYSTGSTFFIGSHEKPRCQLEKMALSVFNFHAKRLGKTYDTKISGAEWWTQCIDSRDDIGFHWDRDYDLEERTGELRYPDVGTVTYLTDVGVGTMVLPCEGAHNDTGNADSAHLEKPNSSNCFNSLLISKPKKGKHMYFDGRLLHAAPGDYDGNDNETEEGSHASESDDEEEDEEVETRVTFLVNVWFDHKPEGSCALPKEALQLMSKMTACMLQFDAAEIVTATTLTVSHGENTKPRTWKFHDLLRSYALHIPLSENTTEKILNSCNEHILLQFPKSMDASLENLGEVKESESSDDESTQVGVKRKLREKD